MHTPIWIAALQFAAYMLLPGLALAAPFAYIPNWGSKDVSVIDTTINMVTATVALGESATGVAVNPAGTRVYVANSWHVFVIDAATNTVVATVPVGTNPIGLVGVAVNPAGTRVYLANSYSKNVSVIDTATNTVIATVAAGDTPLGVAVNPAGTRVYVANTFSDNVSVIDTATNTVVATVPVGGHFPEPVGVAVNSAGTRVYVANQNSFDVSVIDTATNTVIATVAIGLRLPSPRGIAVNPSGTRLYVANGAVIDTTTNTVIATMPVEGYGIALNPTGTRAYVPGSNNVSVVDTATNSVVATVSVGLNPISFGQFIVPPPAANYEGLWWAAPAGSESGWGINFAHQGNVIFVSWFTYDLTGKGWWLVMTAPNTDGNTFAGTLFTVTGPAFDSVPFDPAQVAGTAVGTGTLTFTDANNATFAYIVNGISQTKAITRQVFGPLPTCTFGAQDNLALATNYQDLWWKSPAGLESGWGIDLTHQGDTIFGTWFTYDHDHTPMWLVVTANKSSPGTYSGDLFRTTGPPFNAVPFDPTAVHGTNVGSATFSFMDGNTGSFAYSVNGISQSKTITREVFRSPGTLCQ